MEHVLEDNRSTSKSSESIPDFHLDAGIEGILYTSLLTDKPCIVVYPQNFANASSFVEIDDPVPADTVQKRIDASSLKNFV